MQNGVCISRLTQPITIHLSSTHLAIAGSQIAWITFFLSQMMYSPVDDFLKERYTSGALSKNVIKDIRNELYMV